MNRNGLSLTELMVAILLLSLITLAATSAELTSRRFYETSRDQIHVQDEVKLAMEHIVRHIQQGTGTSDAPGFRASGGTQLEVDIDGLKTSVYDGQFDGAGVNDGTVRYTYQAANFRIEFDPDTDVGGNEENLTGDYITDCDFDIGNSPNQVEIHIEARNDPSQAVGPNNPQASLDTSVVLRGMPCN